MQHTIVIIDDDPANLKILRLFLQDLPDCSFVLFEDARAALQHCDSHPVDLVIVDFMMPGLDGAAVVAALRARERTASLPILMATANDDRGVRHRALGAGATDFLTKPLDRVELVARVRNMLAMRSYQRQVQDRAAQLAEEVRVATAAVRAQEGELLLQISRAAEFRDPETGAHIQRMSNYAHLVARHLGLSEVECDLILHAAPLHDVGKIGIPDAILLKPARLTPEEMTVMKRHAELGYELLRGSTSEVLRLGARIALSHHEKVDGTGYPQGLRGEDIPLVGRIVAVADVFDALTSERPYKKAWDVEKAVAFLREGSGTHFDPRCVDAFLEDLAGALRIKATFLDVHQPVR